MDNQEASFFPFMVPAQDIETACDFTATLLIKVFSTHSYLGDKASDYFAKPQVYLKSGPHGGDRNDHCVNMGFALDKARTKL